MRTAAETEITAESVKTKTSSPILIFYPRNEFRYKSYLFFKRVFDVVSSGIALVVLSPLILVLLLLKYLEDFHNPIYVSTRIGKNGKAFNFYKIRSMRPNADQMKQSLIDSGMNEADGPVFKIKGDPRITPLGSWLRKSSLDEILQLVNIFLGDMSVVGPRPPIPNEVQKYTAQQLRRLDVKGGLLCLWQIQEDRHSISFDDWVKYDIEYINNQCFFLDMKIIFKGAFMVLSGKSGD